MTPLVIFFLSEAHKHFKSSSSSKKDVRNWSDCVVFRNQDLIFPRHKSGFFFRLFICHLVFLLIAHQLWLFMIVLGEKCLPATSSKNTNWQCWNNHKQSLRKRLLLRLINWWLAMSLGQRCSIKVFTVTVIYHWFPVVCPPVKVHFTETSPSFILSLAPPTKSAAFCST